MPGMNPDETPDAEYRTVTVHWIERGTWKVSLPPRANRLDILRAAEEAMNASGVMHRGPGVDIESIHFTVERGV